MGSFEKKIYLEEADRPPPSYYSRDDEKLPPLKKLPFQTPQPEEWLKAPEFVPRSKQRQQLADAFSSPDEPSSSSGYEDSIEAPPTSKNIHANARHDPEIQYAAYKPGLLPHHFAPSAVVSSLTAPLPPPPTFSPFVPSLTPGLAPLPLLRPGLLPPSSLPAAALTHTLPSVAAGLPTAVTQNNALPFLPPGYSANIANINPGIGPPIPAIVLKKRRRRRNKHKTNSMIAADSESPASSTQPVDSIECESDEELPNERKEEEISSPSALGGSCPDLTEEQLQMWDDYLYEAANSANHTNDISKIPHVNGQTNSTVYEMVNPVLRQIAEQHLDGISNPDIRNLDRQINGNSMTSSVVMQKLNDCRRIDLDGATERSLAAEMEQLHFRPEITQFGYPQIGDPNRVQMTTYSKKGDIDTIVVDKHRLKRYGEDHKLEEDGVEGMTITVNAFDTCEDLSLSDFECQPSRFEKIHNAIKHHQGQIYTDFRAPDRVCCSIM